MDKKDLYKAKEMITLSAPMTIEELFDFMQQNAAAIPGQFKFKKGLMGKKIEFGVYMQTQPVVTVKDKTVKVTRVFNKTEVSVGGVGGDIKNMKERMAAAKEGGLAKAAFGGQEYFVNVCAAMVELLKSRT